MILQSIFGNFHDKFVVPIFLISLGFSGPKRVSAKVFIQCSVPARVFQSIFEIFRDKFVVPILLMSLGFSDSRRASVKVFTQCAVNFLINFLYPFTTRLKRL